jgi:hypothetical protein
MSDATINSETNAPDPLKAAADAMALAVRAAKEGASDARARVDEAMPAIGRFFSRLTYTTCYAVSYGVVFPTMLVVRAVPKENAIVHGLIDGALAARDAVSSMGPAVESNAEFERIEAVE